MTESPGVTVAQGPWRAALAMAQLRDPWCERMRRVVKWASSGKVPGRLGEFGLTVADASTYRRESEGFAWRS